MDSNRAHDRILHRQWEQLVQARPARTTESWHAPEALLIRMAAAYRFAEATEPHDSGSFWERFFREHQSEPHQALLASDIGGIRDFWGDPASTHIFLGFDEISIRDLKLKKENLAAQHFAARRVYDALLRLGEATGAIRLENPETPKPGETQDSEMLLQRLDEALGFTIDFPNPYKDEFGLETSRGIAGVRAVNSLYQAWRIAQLAPAGPILEIGAGLGRTCYYSRKLGVAEYVIVDLAFTNASQAHFLGQVLGESEIALAGEARDAPVRILCSGELHKSGRRLALAANFDSMTEMSRTTAVAYLRTVMERAPLFLSVNHELNQFRVRDLLREEAPAALVSRTPYWIRKGYAEELAEFGSGGGEGSPHRPAEARETDRLRRRVAEMERETAASRRILHSRSAAFARWLHLLRTKAHR